MVKWTKGSNKAKDHKDGEEIFTGGKDGLPWLEYDALINELVSPVGGPHSLGEIRGAAAVAKASAAARKKSRKRHRRLL